LFFEGLLLFCGELKNFCEALLFLCGAFLLFFESLLLFCEAQKRNDKRKGFVLESSYSRVQTLMKHLHTVMQKLYWRNYNTKSITLNYWFSCFLFWEMLRIIAQILVLPAIL
jgi:hypothetical protein